MKKILFVTREHSAADDLVSRRQDTSRFMILPAHNYQSAASWLGTTQFDLVIINLSLHGLDSFMILSYLLRKHPPVPSIVILEEKIKGRLPTKKLAGLFQVVEEPVDYDALFEEIHQNYDRFISEGLAQLTLPTFVQLIKISRRSLIVECRHFDSNELGMLSFKAGVGVKARCGDLRGTEAYRKIFAWGTSDISVFESSDHENIAAPVSNELPVPTPTEETHPSEPVQTPRMSSLSTEKPPPEETTSEGPNEPPSAEEQSPTPLATESDSALGNIADPVSNELPVSTPTAEIQPSELVQTPDMSSLHMEKSPPEETTSERQNEPPSAERQPPAPLVTESDSAPSLVDRVLAAMKGVPNLDGALLVDEDGTIKESGGQLTEMMGEKVGHAVRMVCRGSERTIDDLNLEGFQAITLESDDYLIACWPLGKVFLTIMVSRPRSLGLVRLKMAQLLPELQQGLS